MITPIRTVNLTKKYPVIKRYRDLFMHPFVKKQLTALHDVTLQIDKGELFALLGPNGAGKTTLIKILCTLILPTSGEAMVNGLEVTQKGKEIRRAIGYVIGDERSFYWRLTGRQNLLFFAKLNNMSRARAEQRCGMLLDVVGLSRDADRVFKDYSTGMRQKLAIARGLLTDPEIIFMDEPTNGLDPVTAQNLKAFIKDHLVSREKKTVVFATHNLQDVEELCDRIAIMHEGCIRFSGPVKDIRKQISTGTVCVMTLKTPDDGLPDRIRDIPLVSAVRVISANGGSTLMEVDLSTDSAGLSSFIREVIGRGGSILSFYEKTPTIQDLFLKMVDTQ